MLVENGKEGEKPSTDTDLPCRRRGTEQFWPKGGVYKKGQMSPDYTDRVLLRDVRAPRWVECCVFPTGRFGVCGPLLKVEVYDEKVSRYDCHCLAHNSVDARVPASCCGYPS
jgi:hypothetical protein